jgi:hypothetical protein
MNQSHVYALVCFLLTLFLCLFSYWASVKAIDKLNTTFVIQLLSLTLGTLAAVLNVSSFFVADFWALYYSTNVVSDVATFLAFYAISKRFMDFLPTLSSVHPRMTPSIVHKVAIFFGLYLLFCVIAKVIVLSVKSFSNWPPFDVMSNVAQVVMVLLDTIYCIYIMHLFRSLPDDQTEKTVHFNRMTWVWALKFIVFIGGTLFFYISDIKNRTALNIVSLYVATDGFFMYALTLWFLDQNVATKTTLNSSLMDGELVKKK